VNPAACLQDISQLCGYRKGKGCPVTCQADIEGGRDLSLPILSIDARGGVFCQRHAPAALPQQRDPVYIVQEAICLCKATHFSEQFLAYCSSVCPNFNLDVRSVLRLLDSQYLKYLVFIAFILHTSSFLNYD